MACFISALNAFFQFRPHSTINFLVYFFKVMCDNVVETVSLISIAEHTAERPFRADAIIHPDLFFFFYSPLASGRLF